MAELKTQQAHFDASPTQAKRSTGALWLGVSILLGLLLLGALVFYLDLQHQGQQKSLSDKVNAELTEKSQQVLELTQQISGYQTQIAAIQSQLANVQQTSTGKDTHFNQALDNFSKLYTEKLDLTRTEFKTALDQVQRLLGKTRSDWMIADAEYLLSVANQRLALMGDVNTAKQALEAADVRLRESEDAGVFKVREQLGKELADLAKVSILDIVGVYAKINALQQLANKLNVLLPYVGKTETSQHQPMKETKASDDLVDKALDSMQSIVAIKRSSVPISAIITKEEAQFQVQQLKVRLDMVKMSLLQHNEALYLATIEDVKHWLADNFTQDTIAKEFTSQLAELAGVQINSNLPDISSSLKMLKAITKNRIDSDKAAVKTPDNKPPTSVIPTPATSITPTTTLKP